MGSTGFLASCGLGDSFSAGCSLGVGFFSCGGFTSGFFSSGFFSSGFLSSDFGSGFFSTGFFSAGFFSSSFFPSGLTSSSGLGVCLAGGLDSGFFSAGTGVSFFSAALGVSFLAGVAFFTSAGFGVSFLATGGVLVSGFFSSGAVLGAPSVGLVYVRLSGPLRSHVVCQVKTYSVRHGVFVLVVLAIEMYVEASKGCSVVSGISKMGTECMDAKYRKRMNEQTVFKGL
jgi:uncharacterized membrane protein